MPDNQAHAIERTLIGLMLVLLWAPDVVGQSVFIQQGQTEGNGLIRTREAECFVVTPEHVVNALLPVRLVREAGRRANGEFERVIGSVAIVRVAQESVGGFCDDVTPWPEQQAVATVLERANTGALRITTSRGDDSRVQVNLRDRTDLYIRVEPQAGERALIQGNSGSALLVEGVVSGMLDSVRTDGPRTLGAVLRIDYVCGQLEAFFGACTAPQRAGGLRPWHVAVGAGVAAITVGIVVAAQGGNGPSTGSISVPFPNPMRRR